jgi:hypothetical protein
MTCSRDARSSIRQLFLHCERICPLCFWRSSVRPGRLVRGVGRLFWLSIRARRWQAVLEQMQNLVLNSFQLVELEIGVLNLEQIAGFRVLVNEDPFSLAGQLGLHLEDALAFQHGGQNVERRSVFGIVGLREFAQERFRGLLLNRFRRGGWRNGIDALPIGDETFAVGGSLAVLGSPAAFAHIEAFVTAFLVEEHRVKSFFIRELLFTRLAGMGPRLDVPFHQDCKVTDRVSFDERKYRWVTDARTNLPKPLRYSKIRDHPSL